MSDPILDNPDNYIDVIPATFSDTPMSPAIAKENLGFSTATQAVIEEIDLTAAVHRLIDALRSDADFAFTWQSNIAMAMVDEGVDQETANRGAINFLGYLTRDLKTTD